VRRLPLRELDQRGAKSADQRDHVRDLIAKKKPHVECYLIVARTRGVEFASRLANHRDQPALDREMNILIGDIELKVTARYVIFNTLEAFCDRAQLSRFEQTDLREHLRVRNRAADIMPIEPSIERQ